MLTLALLGGAPLTLPEDVFRLLETALAPPKKARQDDAMPTPAAGPNPLAYYLSQCRAGWQVKLYPGMPVEVRESRPSEHGGQRRSNSLCPRIRGLLF